MQKIRNPIFAALLILFALFGAGCRKNNAVNPIAEVDSKQPDKVLFDRSMEALRKNRYDTARLTLQTLINTYPDSEYIARAKLAVGDSWYEEGGTAGYAQAEIEYKDFITFFPNMPEAAEAQMKIGLIHFRQMEKPDRDYTHAKRAEDEYRQMILQFPDSSLVPEAKKRLLQVQEVLAEREYRIGRFYFLRESWPAAIARLQSVTDAYPLYSGADEALFMLGQAYESQMELVRQGVMPETAKAKLLQNFTGKAADAYSKILTRYPVTDRVGDAKSRLEALNRPIPQATPEMIAQNKVEEESRSELGTMGRVMLNFKKRPDMEPAVKVGEPVMQDAQQTSATEVLKDAIRVAGGEEATTKTSVETLEGGKLKPNDPAPRSQDPNQVDPNAPAPENPGASAIPELKPTQSNPPAQGSDPAALPPPNQVNDAGTTAEQKSEAKAESSSDAKKSDKEKKKEESSSKKKKKKGLGKLNPF